MLSTQTSAIVKGDPVMYRAPYSPIDRTNTRFEQIECSSRKVGNLHSPFLQLRRGAPTSPKLVPTSGIFDKFSEY